VLPVVVLAHGIIILAVVVLMAKWFGLGLSTLGGVARLHCFTVFGRKIVLALLAVQRVSNHTDA